MPRTLTILRLRAIIEGLCEVSKEIPVVFPAHPRTRKAMERYGRLGEVEARLILIEPVGYLDIVMLEQNACSSPPTPEKFRRKPSSTMCPAVTLRTETEWVELVERGGNYLCPPFEAIPICRVILKQWDTQGDTEIPMVTVDQQSQSSTF